jgi:hypothetical protein
MLAISDASTITITLAGFFIFLALITFLRLLLRKEPPDWRKVRIGLFIERLERGEVDEDEPRRRPPTTYLSPRKDDPH